MAVTGAKFWLSEICYFKTLPVSGAKFCGWNFQKFAGHGGQILMFDLNAKNINFNVKEANVTLKTLLLKLKKANLTLKTLRLTLKMQM